MIPPGNTLGLLGGGQLGRMFAIAARRMGYRVHTYEPSPESPAGQVSDRECNASYEDSAALEEFARTVQAITFEFENIPAPVLQQLACITPIFPDWTVLFTCQNREREKTFLHQNGYPLPPFEVVDTAEALAAALGRIGTPAVLKTADFGYDGKGQQKLVGGQDPVAVWSKFGAPRGVLEGFVDFAAELSVVCARTREGEIRAFPVSENIHTHHILDFSIVPARIDPAIQSRAVELASAITADLKVVGLLAVEMFLTRDGKLLINELAPRPHNSGHYTFDACVTSQFEQQLRAVCGLPLGAPDLLSPVVMVNLLGDVWRDGLAPDWNIILRHPRAKLHLYGKSEARPGRKMGHFCVLSETVEQALQEARDIRAALG